MNCARCGKELHQTFIDEIEIDGYTIEFGYVCCECFDELKKQNKITIKDNEINEIKKRLKELKQEKELEKHKEILDKFANEFGLTHLTYLRLKEILPAFMPFPRIKHHHCSCGKRIYIKKYKMCYDCRLRHRQYYHSRKIYGTDWKLARKIRETPPESFKIDTPFLCVFFNKNVFQFSNDKRTAQYRTAPIDKTHYIDNSDLNYRTEIVCKAVKDHRSYSFLWIEAYTYNKHEIDAIKNDDTLTIQQVIKKINENIQYYEFRA